MVSLISLQFVSEWCMMNLHRIIISSISVSIISSSSSIRYNAINVKEQVGVMVYTE